MQIIQRTFNVCFPRSGHRFLRDMCSAYFGGDLKFRDIHQKSGFSLEEANYIKDHDFGLLNHNKGIPILPEMRYLIQYRHPLESLVSYFEFQVKHGLLNDNREAWDIFLPKHLDYWKSFVDKWCISTQKNNNLILHKVRYSDLYADTFQRMKEVIRFLTNEKSFVDEDRLEKAIMQFKSGFTRYVEDAKSDISLIRGARDIENFKYFDDVFYALEKELKSNFLDPLGIETVIITANKFSKA
jgi:Sulfotransferase domain